MRPVSDAKEGAFEALGVYDGVQTLVLGASGFIGRWVTWALEQRGSAVTPVARDADRAQAVLAPMGVEARVHIAGADERASLEALFERVRPAVVFNLIAYGVNPRDRDPSLAQALNDSFVGWLAEALARAPEPESPWLGNRLVHVGTQYEYGPRAHMVEDAEATPTTLYGQTKLAGTHRLQETARRLGLPAVTARLCNVYGAGEAQTRLLPSMIRAARAQEAIQLSSGEQLRDFTYIEDIAEGLLRLGAAYPLAGDAVNLASGVSAPLRGLIMEMAHQLQIPTSHLEFGVRPDRAEEAREIRVSVERLRHLTGWVPQTPPAEGIRRSVASAQRIAKTQVPPNHQRSS